jgi:L-histidine N-alpha-methyltransferase
MNTRLHLPLSPESSFADDVRNGLNGTPKRLPTKYLYDELGSALFEVLGKVPEYFTTRAESALLEQHGAAIVAAMGSEQLEVLELGVGSGAKSRFLIEAILERQDRLDYHAVDISSEALKAMAHAISLEYPALRIQTYADDYFELLRTRGFTPRGRTLALFLGSSIGNYDPQRAAALLRLLGRVLKRGDGLLLGVDGELASGVLNAAYNDPTGVNAAFAKNILGRINRELGGTFDLSQFELGVHYDPFRSAVDSFLISRSAQRVRISDLDLTISLAAGEVIHTESAYKFSGAAVDRIARESGFTLARSWYDDGSNFAEHLLLSVR